MQCDDGWHLRGGACAAALCCTAASAVAQSGHPEGSDAGLAQQLQNPIVAPINVVLRNNSGFGGGLGGRRFAWQTIGILGYQFEMFGLENTALIGYRALSQDHESAKLVWEVTLHGPLIGLNIRF